MHRPIGSLRVVLAAVLVVAAGSVVLADDPPSPLTVAKPVAYHERLSLDLSWDAPSYRATSTPRLRLTVRNISADDLRHLTIDCNPPHTYRANIAGLTEDNRFDDSVLGAFGTPTGATLRAGQQVTFTVPSEVSPFAYDTGILTADCLVTAPGPGGDSVEAEADAQVVGARHAVAGRFACQLPDGSPGGPVAGVVVHMTPLMPNLSTQKWTTVTDRDGRFAFPTVAAGLYQLNFWSPAGYIGPDPDHTNDPDMLQFVVTGSGRQPAGNSDLLPDPIELFDTQNLCGEGR